MHYLRRKASSLLNDSGFNRDWIEKCSAHQEGSVRGVYNNAQYGEQHRVIMQAWSDIIDTWSRGEDVREIVRDATVAAADAEMGF
jgi:hypothetical protein